MMKQCGIPLLGSHHLGIDDTKNIARVLLHMLADGAVIQITARRSNSDCGKVKFLFRNRIRYARKLLYDGLLLLSLIYNIQKEMNP